MAQFVRGRREREVAGAAATAIRQGDKLTIYVEGRGDVGVSVLAMRREEGYTLVSWAEIDNKGMVRKRGASSGIARFNTPEGNGEWRWWRLHKPGQPPYQEDPVGRRRLARLTGDSPTIVGKSAHAEPVTLTVWVAPDEETKVDASYRAPALVFTVDPTGVWRVIREPADYEKDQTQMVIAEGHVDKPESLMGRGWPRGRAED